MDDAFRLLKAASLLLLLAGLFGCATLQAVPGVSDVTTTVDTGFTKVKEFVTSQTGPASKDDKYCDLFEEPAYTMIDNATQLASATGIKSLEEWSKNRFKRAPTGNKDIEELVKTASENHVWMPVSFEQSLGNRLHDTQVKNNQILDRNVKKNQKLYKKADAALQLAAKDYTRLPYETRLYIVEGDQINAEALPAGYIYVTKTAASDLDDNALQLVLGHEMAHIAKRHTSKQIQQRLVETGVAAEMFQRILEQRSMDAIDKVFTGERVIASFRGKFAQYDQRQELQADACAIRGLLSAGVEPLQAREEYLRKRGTQEEAKRGAGKPVSRSPLGANFTDHPEDKDRNRFFQEAYHYHLRKDKVACSESCHDATAMRSKLAFIGEDHLL
jgi:hypothetical protein